MNTSIQTSSKINWHYVQQVVKWIVYALLFINWVFYIFEDTNRAIHTLTAESDFFKYTSEFATSIDVAAWLILLLMLELETYILEDKDWQGWVTKVVRGVRLVCVAMIAHTIIANANSVKDQLPSVPLENVSDLCQIAGTDLSFVYNLEYTDITSETCAQLPAAERYYNVGVDPVVSTIEGLELERELAYADLIEVVVWVLIILAMELVVRMQDRNITTGRFLTFANRSKLILYLTLVGVALYWASLSHWLYVWDEFLWIAGFGAIELNVNEWRDEIDQDRAIALQEPKQ